MGLLDVLLKQRLRCVETVSRDLSSKQSSMTKDRGKQVQHNDTVVSVGRQGVPYFLLTGREQNIVTVMGIHVTVFLAQPRFR